MPAPRIRNRIYEIEKAVSEGLSDKDIIPFCTKKWGVKERQGRKYKAEYYKKQHADYIRISGGLDAVKMKLLHRIDQVFRKAYKNNDLSNANGAVNSEMKLLGLGKENVDHTSGGQKIDLIMPTPKNTDDKINESKND